MLLSLALSLTLGVLALNQVTSEEFAIETLGRALDLSFGSQELPSGTDENGFQPIPSLKITLTEADVADRTSQEIRATFFRRLAAGLYEEGPGGLAQVVDEDRLSEEMTMELRALSTFNATGHETMRLALYILLPVSLLLIFGLVLLSSGVGRLINPGLALCSAALPGLLAVRLAHWLTGMPLLQEAPRHDRDISGLVGAMYTTIVLPIIDRIYPIYGGVFISGVALLLMAGTTWLFTSRRRPQESGPNTVLP